MNTESPPESLPPPPGPGLPGGETTKQCRLFFVELWGSLSERKCREEKIRTLPIIGYRLMQRQLKTVGHVWHTLRFFGSDVKADLDANCRHEPTTCVCASRRCVCASANRELEHRAAAVIICTGRRGTGKLKNDWDTYEQGRARWKAIEEFREWANWGPCGATLTATSKVTLIGGLFIVGNRVHKRCMRTWCISMFSKSC